MAGFQLSSRPAIQHSRGSSAVFLIGMAGGAFIFWNLACDRPALPSAVPGHTPTTTWLPCTIEDYDVGKRSLPPRGMRSTVIFRDREGEEIGYDLAKNRSLSEVTCVEAKSRVFAIMWEIRQTQLSKDAEAYEQFLDFVDVGEIILQSGSGEKKVPRWRSLFSDEIRNRLLKNSCFVSEISHSDGNGNAIRIVFHVPVREIGFAREWSKQTITYQIDETDIDSMVSSSILAKAI